MGADDRRRAMFNELVRLDPSKATSDILYSGDLDTLYYQALASAAASSVLVSPLKGRIGTKIAAIGDSVTAADEAEIDFPTLGGSAYYRNSWLSYACYLSGGALRRGRNAGVSGNFTSQMASRLQADVLSTNPSAVIILGGTNDAGSAVSAGGATADATVLSNFQSNIDKMVKQCRAYGVHPILATVPPNNNGTGRHKIITQMNLFLKIYAQVNGVMLLDFYAQAVDPTTGNYATAMGSSDGTHPSSAGQKIWGQYVANVLSPLVGPFAPIVCQADDDSANLVSHGLFLGGALNAQGIPPGWSIGSPFGTGLTVSYVTDANVKGNMWQVQAAASSAPYYNTFSLGAKGTNWDIGHKLAVCGIITSTGGTASGIAVALNNGGALAQYIPTEALTRAYFYFEQTVPAGSNSMTLYLNTAAGITETWSIGQLAVYNLTNLGIAS